MIILFENIKCILTTEVLGGQYLWQLNLHKHLTDSMQTLDTSEYILPCWRFTAVDCFFVYRVNCRETKTIAYQF